MKRISAARAVMLPLLIVVALFVTTGCDELFYVDMDGKIKFNEKAYRVLYGGKLVLHGFRFLGRDREGSSGVVRYQHDFDMGFQFRWDLGVLNKKSTALGLSYMSAGVENTGSQDLFFVGAQPYSSGDGYQIFAATQDGVIPGTTFQISTSGLDLNLVTVRITTTMNAQNNTWNLHAYANAFGELQGSPFYTQTDIPNMAWTYQPATAAAGVERGGEGFAGFQIEHAGHLAPSATDLQEINYNFAKGYGFALQAQYKADHWPSFSSSWGSLASQDLQNLEDSADLARSLIGTRFQISFKKSPPEKAIKLIDKAIKASVKARKKIQAGAKPVSVWKATKKARDQLLKSQNLIREFTR